MSRDQRVADAVGSKIKSVAEIIDTPVDPDSALQVVSLEQPDIVYIDLGLQPEEGFQAAEQALRANPDLSVFFMAGEKDPDLILRSLRMGGTDYFDIRNDLDEIMPAFQRTVKRMSIAESTAEIIAFFSPKGGQGNTTLSINLIDVMAHLTDQKVLLLDLNLYMGNVGILMDLSPEYTPYDLVKDIERMDENLLFSSLWRHDKGFYVLTPPDEISDAEQVSADDVRSILDMLKNYFQYIVVDLPHDFSERTMAVIDSADHLLLLSQQSIPEIKTVQSALNLFRELNLDEEKIKIVLNRYLRKSQIKKEDMAEVFKKPVFASIVNDSSIVRRSMENGNPFFGISGNSRISKDIRMLAEQLLKDPLQEKKDALPGKRTGWFTFRST